MRQDTKATRESLKDFTRRMKNVEKLEEFEVGRRNSGHFRAVFNFEGQICYIESTGYYMFSKGINMLAKAILLLRTPCEYYWTDYMVCGKEKAEEIAKYYEASIWESPYAEEEGKWFHLSFTSFEDLMRFCYDRYTGVFEELWECKNPAHLTVYQLSASQLLLV